MPPPHRRKKAVADVSDSQETGTKLNTDVFLAFKKCQDLPSSLLKFRNSGEAIDTANPITAPTGMEA